MEAGVEAQILNEEDQLFILMEAGHLITAIRGMGNLHRFGMHTSLFGRFRDLRAIRDPWRSALALTRRTVSRRRS